MRVGVLGAIKSGSEVGRLVIVVGNAEHGPFRVRTAADRDMTWERAEYAVDSRDALERFAQSNGWAIDWLEAPDLRILYRPTGPNELALVEASDWERWPPRLPGQPIFYPVLDEDYARKIARDWNATRADTGYRGFVTRFRVLVEFLAGYEIQRAGASWAKEYWIPAGDLERLNDAIVGKIEVIAAYRGGPSVEPSEIVDPTRPRDIR